ncbi:MAG: hypothetical protein D6788_10865 [Planctomycetota bacterium]|nr:MAG: hypothetical protein D6788_10865 [Planctomycetota bacterium]
MTITGIRRVHRGGAVAGPATPPVFLNEFVPQNGQSALIWQPGVNERIAEDMELADTSGQIASYSFGVGGLATPGMPATFQVQSALWTGDPCDPTSMLIPGTQTTTTGLPNDGSVSVVEVTLTTPISLPPLADPNVVWLALTIDNPDVGWVLAGQAEVGYSRDLFSENDAALGCTQLFFGGDPLANFWSGVTVLVSSLPTPPLGACCTGTACAETPQADCTGTWNGPFSSCTPNPCQTGACCGGMNFGDCSDTTEAGCVRAGGLFQPGQICGLDTCPSQFAVYRNDRPSAGVFAPPLTFDPLIGDDITFGPGVPCELSSMTATVLGFAFTGRYDIALELWTIDPTSGLPLSPIPGTRQTFTNIGDGAFQRLVAGPYSGVMLPDAVYMVVSVTASPGATNLNAGWVIGGTASIGSTIDAFALRSAGAWSGFDFQDPTIWAGFQAEVSCYGTPPTGACCNDVAESCVDGVTLQQCDGRWVQDATCASNPFTPPCGSSACCISFTCQDRTQAECAAFGGEFAPGLFCADLDPTNLCPRAECTGATGDCLLNNGTPGCDNSFCCEAVCQIDPICCTGSWDALCATTAAGLAVCNPPPPDDACTNAVAISGEGTFPFDNTSATTDGLPHNTCATSLGDDTQIRNDVWRCWTSPCDGPVYVRTCGNTTVDTKMAVYEGCANCPPNDLTLLFCNDDFCGYDQPGGTPLQSQLVFNATAGQDYTIRIGTFPGGGGFDPAPGGAGAITITCGLPDVGTCPGAGDCCDPAGTGTVSCTDDTCCRAVCACDAFCCEVEWDADCATHGFQGSGCGALDICTVACGTGACPSGPVNFLDPPAGVIDARQPFPPDDAGALQGIDTFLVEAPSADPSCWSLCETASPGGPNDIAGIVDNGDGTMTISLLRPISPNAVTVLTYTDDGGAPFRVRFHSHPGNASGDGIVLSNDVTALIELLNGISTPTWGIYSEDIDHSGALGAGDLARLIDLLNGGGAYSPQLGTFLPSCGACCPR